MGDEFGSIIGFIFLHICKDVSAGNQRAGCDERRQAQRHPDVHFVVMIFFKSLTRKFLICKSIFKKYT